MEQVKNEEPVCDEEKISINRKGKEYNYIITNDKNWKRETDTIDKSGTKEGLSCLKQYGFVSVSNFCIKKIVVDVPWLIK